MSDRNQIGRVEDYTTPFLVTAAAILFTFGMILWAYAGLAAVLLAGGVLDLMIQRLRPRG